MDAWPELDRHMHQLADLGRMSALLSWDQQVLMPRKGAEGRARAVATLRVIRHRQLTDPRLGELLDDARDADLDVPRAAMVRVLAHDRDRAVKLPDELVRRLALAGSRGQAVWEVARKNRDWSPSGPYGQGSARPCEDTPIAEASLLGLHESQSRLWENLVGRSLTFWGYYTPVMREMCGGVMGDAGPEDVYREVNRVQPALIRVEAD